MIIYCPYCGRILLKPIILVRLKPIYENLIINNLNIYQGVYNETIEAERYLGCPDCKKELQNNFISVKNGNYYWLKTEQIKEKI